MNNPQIWHSSDFHALQASQGKNSTQKYCSKDTDVVGLKKKLNRTKRMSLLRRIWVALSGPNNPLLIQATLEDGKTPDLRKQPMVVSTMDGKIW